MASSENEDETYYNLLYAGPEHHHSVASRPSAVVGDAAGSVQRSETMSSDRDESDSEFFDSVAWQELMESDESDHSHAHATHKLNKAVFASTQSRGMPSLSAWPTSLTYDTPVTKKERNACCLGCCACCCCDCWFRRFSKKQEHEQLHERLFGSEGGTEIQKTQFNMAQ